jgi:hypothetical protein
MFAPIHSAVLNEMAPALAAGFPPRPQAQPTELALKLPGKDMHMRALCCGLTSVRTSLLYVKNQLEDWDVQWELVQDAVARELTIASMLMGGILDGCVIAELQPPRPDDPPLKLMSFSRTLFTLPKLRDIQEEVNSLRSGEKHEQEIQASLWTVVNFWKHYLPYKPLPTKFTSGRLHPLRDFQLVLSGNGDARSGPVMHDLLIPAFNAACRITHELLAIYKVDGTHSVRPIPIR